LSKLMKYLLFTFITAWIIGGIGCYKANQGGVAGESSFHNAMAICMFMPMLGALFVKADVKEMGWRLRLGKNWKYILFAWLAPTVFQIIGAALYFMVFPDDFAPAEAFQRFMTDAEYEEFRQNGSQYTAFIISEIFYSLTSFDIIIAIVLGLGEEIGWRGFMYPELKTGYGRTKGLLIGGVIHGVWHFPVMLAVGYEYGKDYIGAPLLGFAVFCVFTVSMGVISDFLYVRSGSIWLTAILHGMINSSASPRMLLGNSHPERSVFGPDDVGLIAAIPMVTCAVLLLWRQHKQEQMELDEIFSSNSISV